MTDLVRLTMRVPQPSVDELKEIADAVAVRTSTLYPVALLLGMRVLSRQLTPEKFTASELSALDKAHRDELRSLLKAPRTKKK